ncbi:hypothetical protein PILCRDRAFT_535803 [Piloderma croceum F 1598]|uniref:O-methyltransferase C-terminal domain-containing protein n=1 Tax=Piloderma croceum (strain F 1598) TaxID=765440 RepID=A0A0C3B1Q1_PILCF|nr:hypothetical protein PILCRDRAFT_535803 [Piloderma croceum F 1598]
MTTPLSALSNLLSSGIATIEAIYAKHGATFPSIDEPFRPGPLDGDESLCETTDLVIAAASQLIALVKPPPRTIVESGLLFHLPASLQVVVTANLTEILREAGPQGLHIKDIGERCGSDPQKIGRILRCLATNHIFREIAPDVFANNRISSALDTGKSVAAIKADPIAKHDNTSGISALVGHSTDEIMKAGVYLTDNLMDPKTAASQEALDAVFSRAFGRVPCFEFLEKPGNEYRLRRFGAAMHGVSSAVASDALVTSFDWKSLQQDALVVDVGGGVGSWTLQLMKAYPHLRYVIQERSRVIPDGIKFWENTDLEALKSGRVKFKEHDFFEPQPIKDAAVFFMRCIIHDWADGYAKKILKHLRASALPSTKLILYDYLVPYAASTGGLFSEIPGSQVPVAPYPLLPNLGSVSNQIVLVDLQMMVALNSQERTIGQLIDLVDGTGWKLVSIGRSSRSAMCSMVFETVAI